MTPPEERVSLALSFLGLNYKYEPTLFLRYRHGGESIRYPDFYLPQLDLYIEARSLDRDYDKLGGRVRRKNRLYRENKLNWIEIDPAYTVRDGKRRLKSIEAIQRDLKKKLSNYIERRKHGYLTSGFDKDIFGQIGWLGSYKSKGIRGSYSYGPGFDQGLSCSRAGRYSGGKARR